MSALGQIPDCLFCDLDRLVRNPDDPGRARAYGTGTRARPRRFNAFRNARFQSGFAIFMSEDHLSDHGFRNDWGHHTANGRPCALHGL